MAEEIYAPINGERKRNTRGETETSAARKPLIHGKQVAWKLSRPAKGAVGRGSV